MSLFYTLSKNTLAALFWAFYNHKTYFPDDTTYPEGVIIAANHASFFDPPLVAVSWKSPIHFLARKTLFDVPLLQPVISALNAHPIESSKATSSVKAACQLLEEKKNIVIFPEGTRSKTGQMNEFKSGVQLLAKKSKAPVVPCYIHGSYGAWPKNKRLFSLFGYETSCSFGKPLYIDQEENFLEALEEAVKTLMISLPLNKCE